MNNNDILGTQSQADLFLTQKIAIFGIYLYVDNVDEIFHPHLHIPHAHNSHEPHIPHTHGQP